MRILAPISVPFGPTSVKMPNLALIETNTVYSANINFALKQKKKFTSVRKSRSFVNKDEIKTKLWL
jgi:hypothetical protein